MVSTLIDKLGGLLDKHFLFASFVPVFFFIGGNLLIVSLALGLSDVWLFWSKGLETGQQALLSGATFILAFMCAYVLSSLRGLILGLWCGTAIHVPLAFQLLKERQRKRFITLEQAEFAADPWQDSDEHLREGVAPYWSTTNRGLDAAGQDRCASIVECVHRIRDPLSLTQLIRGELVGLYREYDGNDLTELYRAVRKHIERLAEEAQDEIRRQRVQLDLDFGSYATIRSTALGNIVEAYNQYPFRRYQIDGELLWPRLVQVTTGALSDNMQDKKAFLDFSLATATLLVVTAVAVLLYGPFLATGAHWSLWPIIACSLLLVSAIFYRVAVAAARDFGDALRAACDLFRLDLMKSLGRPWPADLASERAQWGELSQLAAYGTIRNFAIRGP